MPQKQDAIANNADMGISFQKEICDYFEIEVPYEAVSQFEANYNSQYQSKFLPIIKDVFNDLKLKPVKCLTYVRVNRHPSPHNFILDNGATLSIRTNKKGAKCSPRIIGQAGFDTLNEFFGHLTADSISNQRQIKELVLNNISKIIPVFLDYLFLSDYTVWVYSENNQLKYTIFDRTMICDIQPIEDCFSFTRNSVETWIESTTLKYNNISIAEIQVHKNRTFKFRFALDNLLNFIRKEIITNETFGISAEKAICDQFHLSVPPQYQGRYSVHFVKNLAPLVDEAFKFLPGVIDSTGATSGKRGEQSKCSYDFILQNNQTLSVKTNLTGHMICPPEVGQPGAKTCLHYFKKLTNSKEMTPDIFKQMVFDQIHLMLPIYLKHLFDSNYLLWFYQDKGGFKFKIFQQDFIKDLKWEKSKFSFTRQSVEEWNESNTLKYNGVKIGEFQVHKARSCFKFRFEMLNLERIIQQQRAP